MDAKYLEEIRERCDDAESREIGAVADSQHDVMPLLAEVERLKKENAVLKAELQDSHQDHVDDFMRLKTENATLEKALELMHADAESSIGSFLPSVDEFIFQAQQTHETQEAEKWN